MRLNKVFKLMRTKLYGFTQSDMAWSLGLDKNTIARLERGEMKFTLATQKHVYHMLMQDRSDAQVRCFIVMWEQAMEKAK